MEKPNNTALLTGGSRRGGTPFRTQQSEYEKRGGPADRTRHRWLAVGWNLLLGLLSLVGTYIFASLALDSARYIEYIAALVLLIFAINRFVQAIKRIKR